MIKLFFLKLWDALNIDIPILQKHLEKILTSQEMIIREATFIDIEGTALIISRNFDEVMATVHSKPVLDKFKAHNTGNSLLSQLRWKKVYVAVHSGEIVATGAFANFGHLKLLNTRSQSIC